MCATTLVTGRERMSSKERVAAFFAQQECDRVPIDAAWNPEIRKNVMAALGVQTDLELRRVLGVDFLGAGARYVGAVHHAPVEGRNVDPVMGIRTRWVEHGAGGYYDYCDFPLSDAEEDEVAAWPLASADEYDVGDLRRHCQDNSSFAIHLGHAGLGCIINTAGMLRGMEQVLVDLITDDKAGLLLIDRFLELQYNVLQRELDAAGDLIDFIWMGEDLGTQDRPMISLDTFRKHIRPRQQRFFDLARAYDKPTLFHTCGSSSWAYEDYIEMGASGVDTLQPEAFHMDPAYLKATFGGRLAFHGCISTTGKLSFGSPEDVRADCREVLQIMMPGGGYAFSPTHCIQDNTPVENVLAMYETVNQCGWYD